MTEKTIKATLAVTLRPFVVPNFATFEAGGEETSVPVKLLDDDALEDMALAWVRELYRKAGRSHAPFYKPAKADPQ